MSGFDNSIVNASNELIRTAMESPNYQHGVTGWAINKDGSAEFNNLTVRGVFYGLNFVLNNQGLFFYSSTPALGNLVISIAPATGTDSFGNVYKAGLSSYQGVSAQQAAVLVNSQLSLYSNSTVQDGVTINPSVIATNPSYPGELKLWSGQMVPSDAQAVLNVYSANNNDPSRVFGSGSEIDISAAHLGITGNTFVQGAHGIFGQDAAWVNVGMASGWAGRGAGYSPFQVYRTPLVGGVMLVRGWVQTSNSTANGTAIATLGSGYYNSSVIQWIPCQTYTGTAVTTAGLGIQISTSGNCTLWGITTAGTIGIVFSSIIFLDNLS